VLKQLCITQTVVVNTTIASGGNWCSALWHNTVLLLLLLHLFNSLFSRTNWVSWQQKGKPFSILLQQEMMGGSCISGTICKSFAPCSRQITMIVPHHSVLTGQMPSCHPTNNIKALKALVIESWYKSNNAPSFRSLATDQGRSEVEASQWSFSQNWISASCFLPCVATVGLVRGKVSAACKNLGHLFPRVFPLQQVEEENQQGNG